MRAQSLQAPRVRAFEVTTSGGGAAAEQEAGTAQAHLEAGVTTASAQHVRWLNIPVHDRNTTRAVSVGKCKCLKELIHSPSHLRAEGFEGKCKTQGLSWV